ncbi:MAG TPA: ACT domain-containing protein [Anaeromyxobacteraceae bacterium]|nr:ACT domain-containing protein [Anaeromyxobacteraceae bacterium]
MLDLVIALIGPDRPGVVEAVAEPIAAHGGNWLESRMSHLAGEFAGILRIEAPADQVESLVKALLRLEERGLKVIVEESPAQAAPPAPQLMDLDLVGTDRPGIVREISHLLAAQGVNIEEFSTNRSSAPMSGELIFRAQARLRVPAPARVPEVRALLEKLAADLMVEIAVIEEPSGAPHDAGRPRP